MGTTHESQPEASQVPSFSKSYFNLDVMMSANIHITLWLDSLKFCKRRCCIGHLEIMIFLPTTTLRLIIAARGPSRLK